MLRPATRRTFIPPFTYAAQWGCDPVYDTRPRIPGDGYLFYNFGSECQERTPEWLTKFLAAIDRTLGGKLSVKDKRGLLKLRRHVAKLQQIACLDEFTRGYITAALWSETTGSGTPLDQDHDITDINADTLKEMAEDCTKFQRDNGLWLDEAYIAYRTNDSTPQAHAGHDLWLTRNRVGVGFWDGDLPDDLGKNLTAAAHVYGEAHLCIGDEKLIHDL